MTDAIITFFENTLKNDILTIIVIAMIPIIELRGSIPVGVAMGMPLWESYLWAWVGSSLVCPVLLLILRPVLDWMKKTKWFRSLALAVEGNFRSRADKVVKGSDKNDPKKMKKKMLGVYAFVAVPLPLTGAWTGSAIAAFLDMPFWKALVSVLLGNLTAGAIVTTLTYFFKDYVDIILTVFLIIVVVVLAFYIVMVAVKMHKNKKRERAEKELGEAKAAEISADGEVTDGTVGTVASESAGAAGEDTADGADNADTSEDEGKDGEKRRELAAEPGRKDEDNGKAEK